MDKELGSYANINKSVPKKNSSKYHEEEEKIDVCMNASSLIGLEKWATNYY